VAGSIFISYRRDLNRRDALHLQTLLGRHFGDKRVFVDSGGIPGGANFAQALDQKVAECAAMVVLMGQGWADVTDKDGKRRLDDVRDFVRVEIIKALQRKIPVLPVLIDGAAMPRETQIPQEMWTFLLNQAVPLRTDSFTDDGNALARQLKVEMAKARRGPPSWALVIGLILAVAIGIALGGWIFHTPNPYE